MKCLYQDILDTIPVDGGEGMDVACFNKSKSKRECRGCETREEALWWKKEQGLRNETTARSAHG